MCKSNRDKLLEEYLDLAGQEKDLLAKMKIEHETNPYYVDDNIKNCSEVCFVFSCPGREELIANKVCIGQTGSNLDALLCILNSKNKTLFPFTNRYKYDILNASNVVHFEALDGRSEAKNGDIKARDNLKRITTYLNQNSNLTHAILLGDKAELLESTFTTTKPQLAIVKEGHLGLQSLNARIKKDVDGKDINETNYQKSEDRTKARLEVVADEIIKQIQQANAQN